MTAEHEIAASAGCDDRERLLESLTGVRTSRISYYNELKRKIRELAVSNDQLREAKRVTDELYQQVRRNADELTLLYEQSLLQADRLDRAIASVKAASQALTATTQGVDVLVGSVLKAVADLFQTEYALMSLGAGEELAVYGAEGRYGPSELADVPVRLSDLAEAVARRRRSVVKVYGREGGIGVLVGVPMFREERLEGSICLQIGDRRDFGTSDLSIVQTLSNQAAMAIANARLFDESQRLQAETKRLYEVALEQKEEAERKTRELSEARQELDLMQKEQILGDERNRIARELHDSVAQILTSIGLNMEWCRQQLPGDSTVHQRLLYLKQLARNGVYEIRDAIFELSSLNMAELGLVNTVRKKTDEFQRVTGIRSTFAATGEVRRLPLPRETALYHVAQEALYNVFKHAQATRVEVEIAFQPRQVQLQVVDDGVGISENALSASREGQSFGLRVMFARVQEAGGTLEIKKLSKRARGTRIRARVPLEEM